MNKTEELREMVGCNPMEIPATADGRTPETSLSPAVTEWLAVHEQQYGHKPSEFSVQMAQHIDKARDILREWGREDAQQGKDAYSSHAFAALVVYAFRLHVDEGHKTVQAVAGLWQNAYMAGYREAGRLYQMKH